MFVHYTKKEVIEEQSNIQCVQVLLDLIFPSDAELTES